MKMITITNFGKKILLLSLLLTATVSFAQEEEEEKKPKLSFGGSVDAYYRTNLTATDRAVVDDGDGGLVPLAPFTSFATDTGFALGFANLIASYEGEKTGAVADLVFGPRGEQAITGLNINQLFAYWNITGATKVTLGRFNTYLGYEVISPVANFNYSTSHLFSNGPFSHTGLKVDFDLGNDFSLMLAFMNVTDTDFNFTGNYAVGAQLGYSGQFLNFYYDNGGDFDQGGLGLGFEVDYTGGFDLTEDFYLGINAAYTDDEGDGFYGVALYPQYNTSESFALGLRGEYFSTFVDADEVDDVNVFTVTLTGSYTVENLIIKPEIRIDSFGDDVEPFFDNDLDPSGSLASFLVAAIYSF